jgi:hypothetical protein
MTMDIKSWNNISPEGKLLWDKMLEKDKGTILSVLTDAASAGSRGTPSITLTTISTQNSTPLRLGLLPFMLNWPI